MAFNIITVCSYYILQSISARLTQSHFDSFLGVFEPSELIDGIRRMYVTREGWLSPFPWCEEFQFFVGDIFTWLKVVRRRKTRGEVTDQPITMSSLLHPHEECSEPRTVLIEGKPGIGKTTYCMKYVYDWATKKLNPQKCFPSIKAVLFLKCRDFKSDIWEVIDDQLLPEDVEEGVKQQFFQFILANQSSILLILDGLDELPASKAPVISKLVTGKVLPECYIVATTRHEAGIKLRKCCHTLLEVEGFTEKHASEFIAKYFKGKSELAEKLLARISKDKNLQEMCANPLNAALLCLLCEEVCGTLPENRTKLYLNMIECVLRRYRKKTELPDTEEDLTNLYKPQLKTLGLIALNGLIEDKLDFEVNELGNHANEIAAFGFLSVHPGGSKLRRSLRYAFLHKSFQECFAAFHLCCEIQDRRTTPEELVSDDKYSLDLTQVLLFLCGILADQSDQEAAALVSSLGNRFNNLASKNCRSVQFLLEAINECKREKGDFHLKLARCFGGSLNQKHLYVECQFLSEGLAIILSEVIKANATLITLGLCFGCISDSGATSIAKAIKVNNTLTSLDLSNNRISDAGATSIAEAIKVNKNLTHLKLFGNGISDAGATSIAGVIKVNETLTSLDLSNNRISDTGATSTAEAIKVNKTLTYLDLSNNRISDVGAISIAEAIEVNKTLTHLKLSGNGISDTGATSTAEAIKVNKTLTYLDLSNNRISDVGAISIAEAIEVNKTLTHLKLSGNGISDAGATSIAFATKINQTLSHLNLSFNCISDAGATSLAEAVKVNQTLTFLNLSKNRSSDAGASSIAEAIKDNKTLTNVNLSRNGISDAGAKSIAEAIKINKTLTYLNLSFNGINDAGGTCIAEAIKVSKILTHLNLFGNGISDAGAISLAEAVRVNKTLTSLHLFTNPFL